MIENHPKKHKNKLKKKMFVKILRKEAKAVNKVKKK